MGCSQNPPPDLCLSSLARRLSPAKLSTCSRKSKTSILKPCVTVQTFAAQAHSSTKQTHMHTKAIERMAWPDRARYPREGIAALRTSATLADCGISIRHVSPDSVTKDKASNGSMLSQCCGFAQLWMDSSRNLIASCQL